jgi:hypothetical protein
VDEYVEANKLPLLLQRIDNSGGRIAIKTSLGQVQLRDLARMEKNLLT